MNMVYASIYLYLPKPLLIFYEFLFLHSVLVECLFLPSAPNHWFRSLPPSLHYWFPITISFISFCIAFTFPSILWPYSVISVSILIPSVLNCTSDRLAISSSLSCIFLEFWTVLSFGPFFFSSWACYIVRGRALGVHQGGATHVTGWWCSMCVWRGVEGTQMKEQIKAPEKIQLSNREIVNLSDAQFKNTGNQDAHRIGWIWS